MKKIYFVICLLCFIKCKSDRFDTNDLNTFNSTQLLVTKTEFYRLYDSIIDKDSRYKYEEVNDLQYIIFKLTLDDGSICDENIIPRFEQNLLKEILVEFSPVNGLPPSFIKKFLYDNRKAIMEWDNNQGLSVDKTVLSSLNIKYKNAIKDSIIEGSILTGYSKEWSHKGIRVNLTKEGGNNNSYSLRLTYSLNPEYGNKYQKEISEIYSKNSGF